MIDTFQFNMHLKLTLIIEGECIIQEILTEAKEMLRGSTINLGGSLILEYLDLWSRGKKSAKHVQRLSIQR